LAALTPTDPSSSAIQNSFVNSAIGYVNMTTLFGSSAADLVNDARSDVAQRISAANMRDEVKRAWNATMTAQLDKVLDPAANGSPLELLFAYVFGSIQIQLASQTPLSRGTVLATSADPFQAPAIDPQYLSAAIDLAIMREGFKLARRVGETQPLAAALGNEQSPGSGVQTDRQFEAFIRNQAQTEYHPSSTCSQLPRADGGVVDANLLVYGTSNLRVVDASIVPIALSAHLMTATYGLSEVASEIIIEARTPPPSSTTSSAGSEPTGSSTGGGSSAGNNNGGATSSGGQSSGAPTLSVRSAALFVCGAAVASLLL
jgi:choline dehydrogenase-like flavoprotein